MSSTYDIIKPILRKTYGKRGMVDALTEHLADRIDSDWTSGLSYAQRERKIMITCWDWFPGGDTAASVANEIDAALREAGK